MFKKVISLGMLACLALLAGCRDAASSLGIGKRAVPDEFLVVSNPPLTVPPDFALVQPEQKKHMQVLHAPKQEKDVPLTSGEKSLLGKMNGAIKTELQPVQEDEKEKEHFIDPVAERSRLLKNKKEGRLINEGKVEERQKAEPSTLEKIFG